MINVKAARNSPETWRASLSRKGAAEIFDRFLEADRAWLELIPKVDELRSKMKIKGQPSPEQIHELKLIKADLQKIESELEAAENNRKTALDLIPNPPADDAPNGDTEEDSIEIRSVGEPKNPEFEIRDHVDLGVPAGWLNLEQASQLSGSRFVYRMGDFALAELALYRLAIDRLTRHGFTPVITPSLVREEAMYGTGFFPTDEVNIYNIERDDLYLVGTSEVSLAGLHANQILEESSLPLLYAGYSSCFRREAGAAGKDTRGMFRVHQFDKVEMFVFCLPEQSAEIHDQLLAYEEEITGALEIPYRVVNVATGDLGPSASKKYDIEAWYPGQKRYREITSTSNTTDFQARRLGARFRRDGKPEPVHTLNGTAATARALLAVIENHQQEDGTVQMPSALIEFGAPEVMGNKP